MKFYHTSRFVIFRVFPCGMVLKREQRLTFTPKLAGIASCDIKFVPFTCIATITSLTTDLRAGLPASASSRFRDG